MKVKQVNGSIKKIVKETKLVDIYECEYCGREYKQKYKCEECEKECKKDKCGKHYPNYDLAHISYKDYCQDVGFYTCTKCIKCGQYIEEKIPYNLLDELAEKVLRTQYNDDTENKEGI